MLKAIELIVNRMKIFVLFISMIFGSISVLAQDANVQIDDLHDDQRQPYYVLISNDKKLEITGEESKDNYQELKFIDPEWIERIDVLKGKSAKKEYGKNGRNGVVVIYIKGDKFSNIPLEIRNEFKKYR